MNFARTAVFCVLVAGIPVTCVPYQATSTQYPARFGLCPTGGCERCAGIAFN